MNTTKLRNGLLSKEEKTTFTPSETETENYGPTLGRVMTKFKSITKTFLSIQNPKTKNQDTLMPMRWWALQQKT
jgi:hypothetical protein